jgi:glycosyltransferase involved in cell wall biosynthesis
MCAQTTIDLWSLPEEIGIKVLFCRGAEIENWENMLKSWKFPIPKLAVSSYLAKMIEKETGQPVLGIVPNGVNTNVYFSCLPESERVGIGAILGSSGPKDPETTIRVMEMLRTRLPNMPRYMFSFARSHYRLGSIHFKRQPTIAEVREMYSMCKVWFLSSISEGFPRPVLEAMACGCAVVSTDCGGSRDIIEDGVNGFLVGVRNVEAIVHKIAMLCENEDLRRNICANSRKTVRKFNWPNAVDKLEMYLQGIYSDSIEVSKGSSIGNS